MLQITDKANEMIKEFLNGREGPTAVRIMLFEGGCSGPALGMALDEPQENDEVIGDNGITYLVEKALLEKAQPIQVDFVETDQGSGFKLTSSLVLDCSCGCSCNC